MFSRVLLAVLPLLLTSSLQAQTAPRPAISVDAMRRHVEVLASDEFEGRKPGTAGESKTIGYIAAQLAAVGLEPAAGNGSWYQPVGLVTRRPQSHLATWRADGKPLPFNQENLVLIGREAQETIRDAPVYFVGHGLVMRERNVDQLAGVNLQGAVALILYESPNVPNFPSYAQRVAAVTAAGAAAVIAVIGDEIPWSAIAASYRAGQNRLQVEETAQVQGSMPFAEAASLIQASGGDFEQLLNNAPGPQFSAVRLKPTLTLDVQSQVVAYRSHNVIGRLRGSGRTGESALFLGHWDHLGICRPQGDEDRICNGAVDNASGIAMLIEMARNLARGRRPTRDILVLATTAEELGLLGAEYFARHPTVPLESIVGAVNVDTVAISGAGAAVAYVGQGRTPMDPVIAEAIREAGRVQDDDKDAAGFVERQDGWALLRAGVPAVGLLGGAFSDLGKLGAFLAGPYHKPGDEAAGVDLSGASEDAALHVILARKLADPKAYPTPAR